MQYCVTDTSEKKIWSDFYKDIIEFPYYINREQEKKNFYDATKISYQTDNQLKYEKTVPIIPIKDAESNPNNLKYRYHINTTSIVAGLDNMRPIDERSCYILNNILRSNTSLSSPVQCARTCIKDDHKICYYNFVVENYQVNGL